MYQMNQGQTQQQFGQPSHVHLSEKDAAGLILAELRRISREYATAALEANDLQVREMFKSLLSQTLRDQEELYETLSKKNGYSNLPLATPLDINNELQKRGQAGQKLKELVNTQLGGNSFRMGSNAVQGLSGQGYSFRPQFGNAPQPQTQMQQPMAQPIAQPIVQPIAQPMSQQPQAPQYGGGPLHQTPYSGNFFANSPYASRMIASNVEASAGMPPESSSVNAGSATEEKEDNNFHFGNYLI